MLQLHHDRITASDDATPERWLLVLHGIYGAGRNWGAVARRFVAERPRWGAVPIDLRGHGRSPALEPPHTVGACAGDVARLVETESIGAGGILGHSFGGKVALAYAANPPVPLERAWIIDSTPDARAPEGSAWRMLDVLKAHPGPFATREAAQAAVEAAGFDTPVAQWMTTNIERGDDDAYRWRLDVDLMEALLVDFFETDAWAAVEAPPDGCELHFVRASASSVLSDEAARRIEAAGRDTGRVHLHTVEGGHWLNADNPDALQGLLVEYM